jgi:hypothetical protein
VRKSASAPTPDASAAASGSGSPESRDGLVAAAVFGLAVLAYANSLANGFVLDDVRLIPANPLVRSLGNLPELFAADYWEPGFRGGLYRPLVMTSYALNHALGGLEPWGYHAVNVLLHAAVSLLVFGLLRTLVDRYTAAIAGLLFAAHAVHAEAVANIAGRAELLAAAGFVLALRCHVARERAADRPGLLYAVGLGSFALALLSKESAITLPAVLLLWDVCFADVRASGLGARLRHLLSHRLLPVYAGYAAVALVYLAARSLALSDGVLLPPNSLIDNPLAALPAPLRIPPGRASSRWVCSRSRRAHSQPGSGASGCPGRGSSRSDWA